MTFTCCNQPAEIVDPVAHPQGVAPEEQVQGVGIMCHVCGRRATGKDFDDAVKNYGEPTKVEQQQTPKHPTKQNAQNSARRKPMNNHPPNRNENQLMAIMNNPGHLIEIASPALGDMKNVERVMKNNLRYMEKSKHLERLYNSPQGQESLVFALEEAMIDGIELGKMGSVVPFGNTCELIESIEGVVFNVTHAPGNHTPQFLDTQIEPIHENDKCTIKRKEGSFSIDHEMGIPRGDVVGIAVYGTYNDGRVLGEYYDTEQLMKKAEEHSTSYQYYLRDKNYADQLRAEGKLSTMNGREYFEKEMSGANGSWKKKIFLDELTNPYAGADKVKMLMKTAGKSFFRPFARVRNAEAAREEIKSSRDAMNQTLDIGESIMGEYESD